MFIRLKTAGQASSSLINNIRNKHHSKARHKWFMQQAGQQQGLKFTHQKSSSVCSMANSINKTIWEIALELQQQHVCVYHHKNNLQTKSYNNMALVHM
jgi:hypothetical protein